MKYDMIIGFDILQNLYHFTFDHNHIKFLYQSKAYTAPIKHWPSFLISNVCEAKVGYCDDKFSSRGLLMKKKNMTLNSPQSNPRLWTIVLRIL